MATAIWDEKFNVLNYASNPNKTEVHEQLLIMVQNKPSVIRPMI